MNNNEIGPDDDVVGSNNCLKSRVDQSYTLGSFGDERIVLIKKFDVEAFEGILGWCLYVAGLFGVCKKLKGCLYAHLLFQTIMTKPSYIVSLGEIELSSTAEY